MPAGLTALSPSPSYLYPDGKNHNPDLTELCGTGPYQRIHVSEVWSWPEPRPCSPPRRPLFPWLRNPLPLSQALDPQRPWGFVLVWRLCDLR